MNGQESFLTTFLVKSNLSYDGKNGSSSLREEWDMIELQGTLGLLGDVNMGKNQKQNQKFQKKNELKGLELGSLSFQKNGKPTLTIGSNLLEGKIENVKKELAILQKKQTHSNKNKISNDRLSSEGTFFEIKGVIKRKIIFKTRPKPLIMHTDNENTHKNKRQRR
mmetsp:Transcript_2345/g.3241  ORF Transcript_2345/g.3241 Transcript_2345/m.3241 type:complete len:165 (+) Transcript_2345:269-763(+)|eukprot:CAMPEP_0204834036 /NCGR_PEP_ID=MMETSP1346-20131115/18511_1 /ASSEMBLY_ACC=CAM_ASM_000771 /TAXON_ID=215587 /ORGANISM="Aplanochytrium stocchinoi, Strain GSBS06" /LENGTH=164 /DNA_ID=CAMNT_0051967017 /DNA_START=208 /DNA_END=702 /DNA_ORIENTATION=-